MSLLVCVAVCLLLLVLLIVARFFPRTAFLFAGLSAAWACLALVFQVQASFAIAVWVIGAVLYAKIAFVVLVVAALASLVARRRRDEVL